MHDDLTREELLVLLMEECAEVIRAASKCLRFGWDRDHPDYGRNDLVLAMEAGEAVAVMEALQLNEMEFSMARKMKMIKARSVKRQFGKANIGGA